VTLAVWQRPAARAAFAIITVVFGYTTAVNVIERPDGLKIATFFIVAIVATSLLSRILRTTELRVDRVEMDDAARRLIGEQAATGRLRFIANRRDAGDAKDQLPAGARSEAMRAA
jgi:hypothetical protein